MRIFQLFIHLKELFRKGQSFFLPYCSTQTPADNPVGNKTRKFINADDIALTTQRKELLPMVTTLIENLKHLNDYFRTIQQKRE